MPKRLTTEEFIERTKAIYGDLFSFNNETVYFNNKTKVVVFCKHHGRVEVQPDNFLNKKTGCPKCAQNCKKPFKEFVREANLVHNNRYSYIEESYNGTQHKVSIRCHEHGVFEQVANSHLQGRGCPKCKGYGFTSEERIERARGLYNDFYDYSKSNFSRVKNKTIITCPIHGDFETNYDNHVNGKSGCPHCAKNEKLTQAEFEKRLKTIYGNAYRTDKTVYVNMHSPLTLTCPIHGDFQRTPIELLNFKRGCPLCHERKTSLEKEIEEFLLSNSITFEQQKKFDWLGRQSLDFYLPDYNAAIECQGKQHFGVGGWTKTFDFDNLYNLDKRKFELCNSHGIKLLYFSNMQPRLQYFSEVFTDKQALLNSI